MVESYEVSPLLIAAAAQAIEELMHDLPEDAELNPDHASVVQELHEVLRGDVPGGQQEEATDAQVEAAGVADVAQAMDAEEVQA